MGLSTSILPLVWAGRQIQRAQSGAAVNLHCVHTHPHQHSGCSQLHLVYAAGSCWGVCSSACGCDGRCSSGGGLQTGHRLRQSKAVVRPGLSVYSTLVHLGLSVYSTLVHLGFRVYPLVHLGLRVYPLVRPGFKVYTLERPGFKVYPLVRPGLSCCVLGR